MNRSKLSELFRDYEAHDQLLTFVGYNCSMLAGLNSKSKLSLRLKKLSSEISNARVVFRLLDDGSMLSYTLSYGLGKKEKVLFVRVLNIVCNLSWHVYYISEHLAWLADNKLINMDSGIYWVVSLITWLICLLISVLGNLLSFIALLQEKSTNNEEKIAKKKKFFNVTLTLIKDISYTINAIHWLPPNFGLWSGKLSDFTSGFLGVLSVTSSLLLKIYS